MLRTARYLLGAGMPLATSKGSIVNNFGVSGIAIPETCRPKTGSYKWTYPKHQTSTNLLDSTAQAVAAAWPRGLLFRKPQALHVVWDSEMP